MRATPPGNGRSSNSDVDDARTIDLQIPFLQLGDERKIGVVVLPSQINEDLANTLQSIDGQSCDSWHIFLMDPTPSGSVSALEEKLGRFRHKKIQAFSSQDPLNLVQLEGLLKSSGCDYITFIRPGDRFAPDFVRESLFLLETTKSDFFVSGTLQESNSGRNYKLSTSISSALTPYDGSRWSRQHYEEITDSILDRTYKGKVLSTSFLEKQESREKIVNLASGKFVELLPLLSKATKLCGSTKGLYVAAGNLLDGGNTAVQLKETQSDSWSSDGNQVFAGRESHNRLSVVIPAFNASSHIRRCLDSVFAESHSDLEVIVVNDGSTDDTRAILGEYQLLHENLIVVDQENRGLSGARNTGLSLTSGQYGVFLDSDDELYAERVWHDLLIEAENNELDVVMFDTRVVNRGEASNRLTREMTRFYKRSKSISIGSKDPTELLNRLVKSRSYLPSACLYLWKRSTLTSAGIRFRERARKEDNSFSFGLFSIARSAAYYPISAHLRTLRADSSSQNLNEKEARIGYSWAYLDSQRHIAKNSKVLFWQRKVLSQLLSHAGRGQIHLDARPLDA